MHFQCKFCRKRMRPKVVTEKRNVTRDESTYYCSLCGEQLFILGGFWQKPFWKQPGAIGIWLPDIFLDTLDLWEKFKNAIREKSYKKFSFLALLTALFIFSLIFYLYDFYKIF